MFLFSYIIDIFYYLCILFSEEIYIYKIKNENIHQFFFYIQICNTILFTGKNPTDDYLDGMMNEAPGPINFTMFLTLFGERLQGTDPEDVIKNAFGCFDEDNNGVINEERLRELLTSMGDRFTDDEVDEMYREAPIKSGLFDYVEFTRILKHGAKDKDEQ